MVKSNDARWLTVFAVPALSALAYLGLGHSAFFGFGAVWHSEAPWAAALAEILDPLDGDPLLERMEANRVYHLASVHAQMVRAMQLQLRVERQEAVLRELLKSRSFSIAEAISRVRQRGRPAVSKQDVRRALSGEP